MRKQRIVITVECDHCPDGQSKEVTETVKVGYGSRQYELDLCGTHAVALDKTMTGIVSGARQVSKPGRSDSREDKQFRNDARAWARENGQHVNNTGIIPAATMAAYREYLRQVK